MLKFVLTVITLYAAISLLFYLIQRDMMYFPTPEARRADADVLWLESGNARLKIWRINEGEKALIYFGGNAEPVEYSISTFRQLFPEHTVYLVNYRGYGGSSGKPTEQHLFADALQLFDHIEQHHQRIDVIGRSLGSGVACYLAEQRNIGDIALITPYDSIREVAVTHYPILPVRPLIKDPFDSLSRAGKLTNRMLLLIAEQDRVVPRKHSLNLIEGLKQAELSSHIIPSSDHNNILDRAQATQLLADFFRAGSGINPATI